MNSVIPTNAQRKMMKQRVLQTRPVSGMIQTVYLILALLMSTKSSAQVITNVIGQTMLVG
jgi:hypothetical protein